MQPIVALLNARILPARRDDVDAVLLQGDRILDVARTRDVAPGLTPDVLSFDLEGRILVPGFQDAHFHFLQYGRKLSRTSLKDCRSKADMVAQIAAAHVERPGPGMLFLEAWDQSAWSDPALPALEDLDAISKSRPIVARRVCGHHTIVNSRALDLLRERWNGDGVRATTGELIEEPSLELDELFPPDAQECAESFELAGRECLALGITTAGDFLRPLGLAAYAHAAATTGPRITAWVLPACMNERGEIENDPGESDRFVVRGLKLFCDGTIGGRTAAVFEDYADRPGERGTLLLSRDEQRMWVRRAHDAGRPVALHAIGDRAIATVLDVFEEFPPDEIGARGHRMEHVEMPRPQDIERLTRLRVRPCVQPNFLQWAGPGGLYETALGTKRVLAMNPFRTLLESGCRPFFGSDGMPASPALGIRFACEHPVMAQRLATDDAIRLYTEDAATPGRPATGRIEPGEVADLAVLADQPDRLPDPGYADLTFLGGELVHRRALEERPGR